MATFDITVDTSPMANSLDYVNSNVKDVTASVVAMESAVVVAQQEASNHICKNVDAGFFILMKSQFDQKIAAVSSEMLSSMQLMETFRKEIDKIMVIMQDDYERIKLRYTKQFSALDQALESRIHELDKKAYEISRNYKLTQFKTGSEVIKAICYSDDTQLINVKQACAMVKSKSIKSIDVMANDVIEQLRYSDAIKSILKDVEFGECQLQYVPVVIAETDSMMTEDATIKNYYSVSEAKYAQDPKYMNQIKEKVESFQWNGVSEKYFEAIKNSYQARVSGEIENERVAREMQRLFNEAKWTSLGGVE